MLRIIQETDRASKAKNRMQRVYDWLKDRITENDGVYKSPAFSKICHHFGCSNATLGADLRWLEGLGLINRDGISSPVLTLSDGWKELEKAEEVQEENAIEVISDENLGEYINSHVLVVRDNKVILDRDLAKIYGVETRRLNEQRERNSKKFPSDFAFQLTEKEFESQNAIQKDILRGRRGEMPWAYTLEGCNMAAHVLKTDIAIQRAIVMVRIFSDLERVAHDEPPKGNRIYGVIDELKEKIDRIDKRFTDEPKFDVADTVQSRADAMETIFRVLGRPTDGIMSTLRDGLLSELTSGESVTFRSRDIIHASTYWREKKKEGYVHVYKSDEAFCSQLGRIATSISKKMDIELEQHPQIIINTGRPVDVNMYPYHVLEMAFTSLESKGKVKLLQPLLDISGGCT